MKFVDEAVISVIAGRGGNGCLSFLREKHRPKGGPDGGDGGDGGSVFMIGSGSLNTLADFRHVRTYKAPSGSGGAGRERSGRSGEDLRIRVPLGTIVTDVETGSLIGEITRDGEALIVAQGGRHGLGNAHFKTSTNRAPRRTTAGTPGDERRLRLELSVLADVGLLGLPNAGKSTFLSAVSHARPKIAEYPFTTLYPQLGVVDVGESDGFVIADIPGLIGGAAEGGGLGTRFLRHLSRTRLLLHMVDIAPMADREPAPAVREIESELDKSEHPLARRERWLILNKTDTVTGERAEEITAEVTEELDWTGPVFAISAATGSGCRELVERIMQRLVLLRDHPAEREWVEAESNEA